MVAAYGSEGAPSFISSHEYELERNSGAYVYAYKFQPIGFDSAKQISSEIRKNGLTIQAPRDALFSAAQDAEIIRNAELIKARKEDADPITSEQADTLYWANALATQRELGHDPDHIKPLF